LPGAAKRPLCSSPQEHAITRVRLLVTRYFLALVVSAIAERFDNLHMSHLRHYPSSAISLHRIRVSLVSPRRAINFAVFRLSARDYPDDFVALMHENYYVLRTIDLSPIYR